jgi:hypothetical protein
MTSTFDSTKSRLEDLLNDIHDGDLQLPEFQRPWVWDDQHIIDLLASVGVGFPIGAVMLMETGGETAFAERAVQGAPGGHTPDRLILDGQQRLTSMYQSLRSGAPVATQDNRKRKLERLYYIDIDVALRDTDLLDAVKSVPGDKLVMTNFGRDIAKDYRTAADEYEAHLFPVNKVFSYFDWQMGYLNHHDHAPEVSKRWNDFIQKVLQSFNNYQLPVITLGKATPREAVCLVFEKVNTGGVPLTVFELLTATFAAETQGFNLPAHWSGQRLKMLEAAKQPARTSVLASVDGPAMMQAIALIETRRTRLADLAGDHPEDARAVSCKRRDVLKLKKSDYDRNIEPLRDGFAAAARFLHSQHVFEDRFVPYATQLIPLAVTLTILGHDADTQGARQKLARWYWCGVFGELYGSTTETRFAMDVLDVVAWIRDDAAEPRTVVDANLSPERLERLRTRGSAAYRGLYALLLREGGSDWLTGTPASLQLYHDESIDIHHIFPQKWCDKNGIDRNRMNSIINKTPLTARTNRIIGGVAPSEYLTSLATKRDVTADQLDVSIGTHFADASTMRTDDFESFWTQRRGALLRAIEGAMGKTIEHDQTDLLDMVDEPDGE